MSAGRISDERIPVSPSDAALIAHVERHVRDENDILDEYHALTESVDPPVRYIAQLILEDEQRHHRVLTEMLNNLRSYATLTDQSPRVPYLSRSTDARRLRETVRRLRARERKDLRELRRLKRRLGLLRDSSLHGVLVSALVIDTRKHLVYLKALARLARDG